MPNIANQADISADGEYIFIENFPQGREVGIEWDITGGTATVTPGYISLTGLFKPALNTAGNPMVQGAGGGRCRLDAPNSGKLALKVEDAAAEEPEGEDPIPFAMKVCAVPLPQ